MKLYRKMIGKIAWLANSTRPDLCYQGLQMSKNNQDATFVYIQEINTFLKTVRERRTMFKYKKIITKKI